MTPEEIIVGRLVKEINGAKSVALGPGIPEQVRALIPPSTQVVSLNGNTAQRLPGVDIAVVEALEINPDGDLSVSDEVDLSHLEARRWIVATRHDRDDGQAKFVRANRLPVARSQCVDEIITELGLIRVEAVGFALREVAPGISSDDVRQRVDASLHVADDLRVMDW